MKEQGQKNVFRTGLGTLTAIVALLLGLTGLAGWTFNSFALRSILSDGATMKVNTALIIITIAAGLILHQKKLRLANILFACSALIGIISLTEYIFKVNLGIDQFIFKDLDTNAAKEAPGRPSVLTLSAGLSICTAYLASISRRYKISQIILFVSFFVIYIALMGHLFGTRTFYYWGNFSGMAFHTALSFMLLQISLLLSQNRNGYLLVFQTPATGKVTARYIMVYLLFFLPIAASFYLFLIHNNFITSTAAVILVVIVSVITFLPIIYVSLNQVNVLDADLQKANEDLRALNEEYLANNEELTAANEKLTDAQNDLIESNSQLKFSEVRFRNLIELSPIATVVYKGPNMILSIANPAALEIIGRDEAVIGLPFFDIMPEMKSQGFGEMLHQVYQTGEPLTMNSVRMSWTLDGEMATGYFNLDFKALRNNQEIIGVIQTSVDITDQKLRELDLEKLNQEIASMNEELAASNEELSATNEELSIARQDALIERNRLREFFMQAPAGICILSGPELSFELVNPLYQQLFPGRDILGKSMLEAIPEVEGSAIWEVLQGVYQTGKTFEGHELLIPMARTSDGPVEDRYFDFIYQARFNDKYEVDGILVFVIEVTEQVNTRQKIALTEENLRSAVQAGELGTFSINTRTLDLYTSPRVKELWGFNPAEEMPLEMIMGQISEDYRPKVAAMVEGAMYRGEKFEMEYPISRFDNGKERWIRSVGNTFANSTGKDSFFVGTLLDITERRADDQRKNDFIGMVSHELKTPLTTLNAIVQVANNKLKASSDTFLSGAMEKANVQVKRMSNMINGFLNVSRLESGKILIVKQPFDLDELLKEVIKENELSVSTHIIHTNFCDSISVNADRDKISSVVSNLISNAIKYSPKGKNIYLTCELKGDEVLVSVRDEGMGIMKEDLTKVFERYYRVQSNAKHISGFGIGLYLTAEIIHHHSGKIWVDSEPGEGSTFHFTLPLK